MKSIQFIYILKIVLITTSCSTKLDLISHLDPTQSFRVVDREKAKGARIEIPVNNSKHEQLLSWLESNNKNWKRTELSYASLFIISQENFRLLLYRDNDFVVVRFTDDESVSHQYVKSIDSEELIFLDED